MAKNNIDLSVVLHDTSDYKDWLVELKERFYSHRLKASCATNGYLLDFYWKLGRDIEAKQYANTYGSGFYKNLSQDLKNEMPGVKGFSPINLRYMSKFFKLYAPLYRNIPQTAELFSDSLSDSNVPQVAEKSKKRQQPVDDFKMLFSIPWDHHRRIIDKCKDDMDKALFFARKTWENNWGRDALLNWLDTDLYERDGKAVTNFQSTLSAVQSDLAQQMTKDPYQFDFLNLREKFDERDIEDELVNNVTRFLLELGKGFSYMGRQQTFQKRAVGEQKGSVPFHHFSIQCNIEQKSLTHLSLIVTLILNSTVFAISTFSKSLFTSAFLSCCGLIASCIYLAQTSVRLSSVLRFLLARFLHLAIFSSYVPLPCFRPPRTIFNNSFIAIINKLLAYTRSCTIMYEYISGFLDTFQSFPY